MPMPSWNEVMWRNQASLLAITFNEKEIISVSSFNNCLEILKSIYSKLIDLDTKTENLTAHTLQVEQTIFITKFPSF